MYGINKDVYENLIYYFNKNTNIKKVILFGSRAKGTEKINSDIDLCIDFSGENRASLIEEIDKLIGIYSCDIVFLDSLNEPIEKQIARDGVEIYTKYQ
ncbi:nucleotidyltransferase family protein [Desnuesiella massiliensis]|uniref:nucleotidyltransferase family protein n=1 Tax=Desnuesiella massiliensis TaxID=1650662 RepID=UPI0006E34868|nr:nucleotidyltransferase domain-containing protein [Desnuesiella massiliensis]